MSLIVLSRRSITFRQPGAGEATVIFVPGNDQIQIVKDLAGVADNALQNNANSVRGPQLSRVFSGQRYIYGYLPEEIREYRQAVKVWLAEDFAPPECEAFFYVFSPQVIVHGVREQSDEGQKSWRTAQLVMSGEDPLKALADAVTDYVLANPNATLCVAVLNQLELYQQLQNVLEPYQITPVPFSKLKPSASVRPLYRHMDHTLIYLTSVLFGILLLIGSMAFWFLNYSERSRLDEEIAEIQGQIRNIQINQSTGHIRRPQSLLDVMAKAFNQQPSAIIHAAASMAMPFGDLTQITFTPVEFVAQDGAAPPQQQNVSILVSKSKDKLLFGQEKRAQLLQESRPWIRDIKRTGSPGEQSQLLITVQSEGAPEPTDIMVRESIEKVSATDLSVTIIVSSTLASGTIPSPSQVVTGTAPAAAEPAEEPR